ncbi:Formate hydrogenlyase subunit 3/multisubunit Na+/H+ antiporter MnhD subunit [Hyphomicrobiales bacterium]|nr:Formate hydrogenlyase subunit 3/multisubunit Na+/H+ antiporter MnhD subunit [Hyphomicrobiales bacterium]CAH1663282.1 Formate hydrogenlyase subunit 3/multisubunit Na+/H+ antiporter MnhD subunit [Hyphomicrobiales bacterium]
MNIQGPLLVASILLPLAMAFCCLFAAFRAKVSYLLVVAPLPALLAALFAPDGTVVFFPSPFRISLVLDRPGAILLGGAALLWGAAGAYATSYLGREPTAPRFAVWWFLTLAGSLGLFIVGDVANFYLLFTLASLAAYGLIVHEQTERAHRASRIYIVLALFGEAFLLPALVMLAAGHADANPLIRDVVATLPSSPMQGAIVALFVLGFALKMGLFPLHVWLPLAHPAAPMPASAVLSGIVVKAGVIGFIRFLPFEAGLPSWGSVLIVLGIFTAYYGVAIGITQRRAKTILAYSTVSQMGLIAVILGVGLMDADTSATSLAAYYAVHHTLVKGALFLAVGILAATGGATLRPVLLLTAVLALSLGGMPLTSGALAKLAAKPMLGYGFIGGAMALAGAGSTLLMLHFLTTVARDARDNPPSLAPLGQIVPWLVVALASLVVPWSLYPAISGEPLMSLLQPDALWKVIWPMLLGALAMLLVGRQTRLPGSIPEGDIIVLAEGGKPIVHRLVSGIAQADSFLRRWSTAGLSLIGLIILLGGVLMFQSR